MNLSAYLGGLGVLGPGLADWPQTRAVLSGQEDYRAAPTVLPMPRILAASDRRRVGRIVKLALNVALEATSQAGGEPAELVSVFSSSGGDGQNCHEICHALTLANREISPTRFANSVHNAAAGYWSIGTGAMAESNVLCAFDASFSAGLLEALAQVAVDQVPVLLVAYDGDYPPPLHAKRPIPDAFGVAFVLTPQPRASSLVRIEATLGEAPAARCENPLLETLRTTCPAARSLPLLALIAARAAGSAILEYLGTSTLTVRVEPCG